MIQPNDLPLVCLPIDLSDQAAAQLLEFLHELTDATGWPRAIERHYCAQLQRYYSPPDSDQRDPDFVPPSSDPPF